MRVLIGTRKGLFRLEKRRDGWHLSNPSFLGVSVTNACSDPRDGSVWALLDHGHWGPKLQVSRDGGATFEERTCPGFPEGCVHDSLDEFGGVRKGPASVKRLYTLVPAGPEEGSYWCGTDPGGLFRSDDGGSTWRLNEPLWRLRNAHNWFPGGGGIMLHSILVQPGRPGRIHVGVSCGGVYETADGGATWEPRNSGVRADFLPDPYPPYGQDPHRLERSGADPEVLWQQNHCGNFRSTDGGRTWTDVMPGHPLAVGFAIALDAGDPGRAWTVPMDSDERRVAREGALVVCRTDDCGRTWTELRRGLPQRHCYDLVFRHALAAKDNHVLFGTTCGNVFMSSDRGDHWERLDAWLPPVNSLHIEP